MGAAAIASTDQFRHRDFRQSLRRPEHLRGSFAGFFGSLEEVNITLRTRPCLGSGDASAVEGFDGELVAYKDYDLDVTMVPYAHDHIPDLRTWLQRSVLADGPAKVGIEDWHLASIYNGAIARASPDSELVGVSEMILKMRMTKGRDEMDCIRQANKILDHAFKAARETAVAGKTEFEVFAQMNRAAFERFGPLAVIAGSSSGTVTGFPSSLKSAFRVGSPIRLREQSGRSYDIARHTMGPSEDNANRRYQGRALTTRKARFHFPGRPFSITSSSHASNPDHHIWTDTHEHLDRDGQRQTARRLGTMGSYSTDQSTLVGRPRTVD